jgi:hypothetical protein
MIAAPQRLRSAMQRSTRIALCIKNTWHFSEVLVAGLPVGSKNWKQLKLP